VIFNDPFNRPTSLGGSLADAPAVEWPSAPATAEPIKNLLRFIANPPAVDGVTT
jgi:hypothetical protein